MHDLHGRLDVYWVWKVVRHIAVFERPEARCQASSPSNSLKHAGNLRFSTPVEIDNFADFEPEVCVVTCDYGITTIGEYRNHHLLPL